ncbi:PREDICTED: trihelix transcription factor ASIL2 [Nelumbo nucifera]|uniref:Trihelix transcription factor ASIL2 n=1 Tax=Nelumbo nucifera TaxID=4432 RepID=A0A1U8B505_NELNU|nr:PREDICTED: trihelix transcription factor ASIL2 [Nelumbo nucifera]
MAASSSSAQDPTPTASARPTPQPSRRLPPPCWTHEETVALIDSYREKWYSLRRGNLKASHWQEVADAVARRCRFATPSKTSVQCRHKVEKLRKRYRTEKQRSLATPGRFSSSWVYFRKMDAMEKGPSATANSDSSDNDDNGEDDEDENEDDTNIPTTNTRSLHRLMTNGGAARGGGGGGSGGGLGFRLRIPNRPSPVQPVTGFRSKNYGRVDELPNPNPNINTWYFNGSSSTRSGFGKRRNDDDGGGGGGGAEEIKRETDPVSEMVSSIKLLGEGFVKMEQMKIEMAREIERMRMEMEMKRTEMILESQERIVDAFTKGFSGKKKVKRMSSPDS